MLSEWMISNKSYYSIRSEVYAPACVAEVAEQGMNPLRLRGLRYCHSRNLDSNVSRATIFNMIISYVGLCFGDLKQRLTSN